MPRRTIIAATTLNFCVRNGNRCDHSAESPEQNIRLVICSRNHIDSTQRIKILYFLDWIFKFPNRNRLISTPRLNILLCLHLEPINVIISHESQTIPYLGDGFILRCFQNLSVPNLATLRCPWQDSRHTRGSFKKVLSYYFQSSSRICACSR